MKHSFRDFNKIKLAIELFFLFYLVACKFDNVYYPCLFSFGILITFLFNCGSATMLG